MKRHRLSCVILGFLVAVSTACRPSVIDEEPAATVAPPTVGITPTTEPRDTKAPTATAPLLPTAKPTVTSAPDESLLPENWHEIGRQSIGLSLLVPANWVDAGNLADITPLTTKLGREEILFVANSLDTGVQVLTGRTPTEGAFALGFQGNDGVPASLALAGETDPVTGLKTITSRLGAAETAVEPIRLSSLPGAYTDIGRDPTGVLTKEDAQMRFRLALFIQPETHEPTFLILGTPSETWERYEIIFNYMMDTIIIYNDAGLPEGVRFLDTSEATGGRDEIKGQLQKDKIDFWIFNADGGQYATLVLTPELSSSDFTITLLGPSGRTISQQDSGYGGDTEVLADVLLPETGSYIIQVSEFFNEADPYKLSVVLTDEAVYGGGGRIELDQEIEASLQPGDEDNWVFEGQAGQVISIILTPKGEFDARFTLYSPNGSEIATFDEGYSGDAELLAGYSLPVTGEYRIVVRSFSDKGGNYSLALDEGGEYVTNFYEAGDLVYGAMERELLREDEVHAWYIDGLAGDEIMLEVTPLNENIDVDVWLLDPDARRLVMQDEVLSGEAETIEYTLPRDGQYIVVVQEFFGESGEYQISLSVSGDNYLVTAGEIAYDDAIEGTLQPGRGTVWHFDGELGDRVTITAEPANADSDLVLSLRNPQAQPEVQVDETLASNDETLTFVLTQTGRWAIVVQEYFDDGGSYALRLTKD